MGSYPEPGRSDPAHPAGHSAAGKAAAPAEPIITYSDKPRAKKNNFRRHIRTSSADSIA